MTHHRFGSLFLGPAAENADLVERFVVEALRDHVFWRRNFHPEDGTFITEADKRSEGFETATSTMRQELYQLLSRLKHGAPFFSPRYIGHMASDTMIASLVGYFAAMLYNPNNISEEAAPVTMELELEVGAQLAELVGYGPAPWGHLTSGGSVANLEALWAVRALKYFAPAVAIVARELELGPVLVDLGARGRVELTSLTAWELMNVPVESALDLRDAMLRLAAVDARLAPALDAVIVGQLGVLGFHRRFERVCGEPLPEPVVLLPSTKHYSWVKVANILGLGAGQLVELPLDAQYRIDVARFESVLHELDAARVPVMALVAVLGATETGSVDRLDRLMAVRSQFEARGLSFYTHVDGAYGGYATAMFKDPQGRWVSWSPYGGEVAAAFKALPATDSLTVDPHKLGYTHYPAGAIVFKDQRMRELLAAAAPYVFIDADEESGGTHAIGQYIVEGSKPGAAAAAVWLCHRVNPLDVTGYGALIGATVTCARALKEALAGFDSPEGFRLIPLNDPDLNLVNFIAVPPGVTSLAELNAFNEALFRRFATNPERVVFTYDFLLSKTEFDAEKHEAGLQARLDPDLWALVAGGGRLTVLRSTVMNPFIAQALESGHFFQGLLRALAVEMRAAAPEAARAAVSR